MKLNLKQELKALNGEPLRVGQEGEVLTLGKALAHILLAAQESRFDKLEAYQWAKTFYEKQSVELEKPILDKLRQEVEKSQAFSLAVIGPILEILSEK